MQILTFDVVVTPMIFSSGCTADYVTTSPVVSSKLDVSHKPI